MLKFDVITLFPELFTPHLQNLPFRKGLEKKLIDIKLHNLRDYAVDKHGTVDDRPYGGGPGMILMVEPIVKALEGINNSTVILLSPRGEKFTQKKAEEYSKLDQITLICGRYEGVDARVEQNFVDEVISIGDYVVSGGELPALVVMESVVRLLPGILEKQEATKQESFTNGQIEHPQYTRPENFRNLTVPKVLLSGDHKKIEGWKEKNRKVHKNP